MKVPKDYDVCGKDVIPPEKGDNFTDNPGIMPSITKIPLTPGESATNDTAGMETNKAQPFGPGGSGYTSGKGK